MSGKSATVEITVEGSSLRLSVSAVKTFDCGNKAWLELDAAYPSYRCEACGDAEAFCELAALRSKIQAVFESYKVWPETAASIYPKSE